MGFHLSLCLNIVFGFCYSEVPSLSCLEDDPPRKLSQVFSVHPNYQVSSTGDQNACSCIAWQDSYLTWDTSVSQELRSHWYSVHLCNSVTKIAHKYATVTIISRVQVICQSFPLACEWADPQSCDLSCPATKIHIIFWSRRSLGWGHKSAWLGWEKIKVR